MEKSKRTRYETELININGKLMKKNLLERLTPIAEECYERNCICENCDIVPKDSFHGECKIKDYVEGYIFMGMLPKREK